MDAEYVEKQALRDKLYEEDAITLKGVKVFNQFPSADVRPVVLCRDCKHKGWIQEPCHGKSIDYCRILERPVELRFFCAAGERKELDG